MSRYLFYSIAVFYMTLSGNFVAASEASQQAFIHGITFKVGDQDYNFSGIPDGPNGEQDIPGHHWLQLDKNSFLGQHYNTGPFGVANWWSSDAENSALLWVLEAELDSWSQAKAVKYFARGFVGYQPIVNVVTGKLHPNKVMWLKHVSIRNFTFDGAEPLAFLGKEPHKVAKGVDFDMDSNWNVQYPVAATGGSSLTIEK